MSKATTFKVVGVESTDKIDFPRLKRSSKFDDLAAQAVKLAVGKSLVVAIPKGEDAAKLRATCAAHMRRNIAEDMEGRISVRLNGEGNLVISHLEKGSAPVKATKKAVKRATKAVSKARAKKPAKKAAKKSAKKTVKRRAAPAATGPTGGDPSTE